MFNVSLRAVTILGMIGGLIVTAAMTSLACLRSMENCQTCEEQYKALRESGAPIGKTRSTAIDLYSIKFGMEDWHLFTYYALMFTAVTSGWAVLAPDAARPGKRGICTRLGIRGSMIGAVLCGTAFAIIYWNRNDYGHRSPIVNSVYLLAVWSLSAVGGAILGGAVGVLWGAVQFSRERSKQK